MSNPRLPPIGDDSSPGGLPQDTDYLSTTEVSRVLNTSIWNVIHLVRRGEFEGAFRLGPKGHYRIPRESVARFRARNLVGV